MMHEAWSSIEQVPYCFSRSSVKFQGRTALKIVEFYRNSSFPDCNSSLNSPMGTKWCTKLEGAWKSCHIVFQCHTSNCKVTRWKFFILTRIEGFRTVTPVWIQWWLWNDAQSLKRYKRGALLFFRSSIKFKVYLGKNIDDLIPILSKITRPAAAIKSLRFALFLYNRLLFVLPHELIYIVQAAHRHGKTIVTGQLRLI